MTTTSESFDFIIVGSGSAGAVLAARLSENPEARVLLLEAGGGDDLAAIHSEQVPDTISLWWNPELNWGYTTEPQTAMENRQVPVARGKLLGGCSSINAMLYVRGSRLDFDYWNYLGNEGWSYDELLPLFKRSEDFAGGADAYRATGGPLHVLTHDKPTPVSECLFDAASELGFADKGRGFDYNGAEQSGSAFRYQATKTKENTRASTAVAFLRPALGRPNLTVRTNAQAARLLLKGTRVVGVEYLQGGETLRVACDQEVIVCGGAYESPKLLMLSGLGPAATLQAHGIAVVADLPGVGQNLQDHMILGVCYLSQQEHPHGPTLLAETGLFTHTRPGLDHAAPNLQLKCGGLKFVSPQLDREGPGFTFAPVLTQPQSVGYVTLRSNSPLDTALLQPNYLLSDEDVQVFLKGIELSRELAHSRAFGEYTKLEIAPGPHVTSEADLRGFVRENAGTLWHAVGTCKMGRDAMAVVDPQLRVHGVQGLRVADASVMPRIVAGNTNAACIMIGEKAADLVRKAYS
jgi:choline dehydrogenase